MAVLKILRFPNSVLREKSEPVADFVALEPLLADLFDTMHATPGALGLAAIQVGVPLRMFVLKNIRKDVDEHRFAMEFSGGVAYVNPEIVASTGLQTQNEGCLSFPEIFFPVSRHDQVTLRYYGNTGNLQPDVAVTGTVARAFQHEMDHLNGRLMIDKIGPVKQDIVRRKMTKFNRENP